ncbi:hypothetical protein FV219_03830 [Methylobacterium sp. WL122]|nr:hypothetical protein FV219_03830 [Methylobacterium sp. WL122]
MALMMFVSRPAGPTTPFRRRWIQQATAKSELFRAPSHGQVARLGGFGAPLHEQGASKRAPRLPDADADRDGYAILPINAIVQHSGILGSSAAVM